MRAIKSAHESLDGLCEVVVDVDVVVVVALGYGLPRQVAVCYDLCPT